MDRPIGALLKRLQGSLRAQLERGLAKKGLTAPQYEALALLEQHPGLSNAELARRAFITPQTMVRILEGLEENGFIRRTPHPSHGKVLVTSLTAEGTRRVAACHAHVRAVDDKMLAPLSAAGRATFAKLLERCADALDA